MRWLWPILMFAMTGWVAWYNDTHTDRQLLFPFVDALFPDLSGDPLAMGRRSVLMLFGLAVGVTLFTFVDQVRSWVRRRERQEEDER